MRDHNSYQIRYRLKLNDPNKLLQSKLIKVRQSSGPVEPITNLLSPLILMCDDMTQYKEDAWQ